MLPVQKLRTVNRLSGMIGFFANRWRTRNPANARMPRPIER